MTGCSSTRPRTHSGGRFLGGIEWVGVEETDRDELPSPELLDIRPA
jgi:hypothetical protein